ncbi:hypothetical protein E0H26_11605 [Micromonospora zingiberis]|uniref:Halobacterial output domain-containing protein n=1 Tax=Micromonospora zingiberis TaxID=2053011 RepID=A0A4R0GL26_9ACTN|nr:hypothetical protein [Micromonospora zingiberis]TCB97557.1 hypothetical protein E0H26_11605 [Micromonospora zingiberis]
MSTEYRGIIGASLPERWPQNKKDELSDAIYGALDEHGLILDGTVNTVEVTGARVTVETVEAYGLTIEVDANGNAVQISSPYGLEIVG